LCCFFWPARCRAGPLQAGLGKLKLARLRLRFQFGEYQPWRLPRRVLVFYLPPPLGAVVASGDGGTSQASLGKVEAVPCREAAPAPACQ
jgi:hypothetical protein